MKRRALNKQYGHLKEVMPEIDYIIINDCSKDRTLEICKENHFNVISLPVNLGIGGAVQTGYRYAKENGYDIAIQMDADGQHNPIYLPKLIEEIEKGNQLVIASRFLEKEGFQSTFLRRVGIQFYSKMIKRLTGVRITDTTSGFRATNREVIELFAESYPVDYPEPETNAILAKKKYAICEIPVKMEARSGRNKFNYAKQFHLLCNESGTCCYHCLFVINNDKKHSK